MLISVGILFLAALTAPFLIRSLRERGVLLLALFPLGVFFSLVFFHADVLSGKTHIETYSWAPQLGATLSFRMDGLSYLFGLLITGIGALVTIYASYYLKGHALLSRFGLYLFLFMGAMLGLVLSDNILCLFMFWELTSISSYLLIGFDHGKDSSRSSALMALLVTGGGGLALFAGLLLLGQAAGSYEISSIISRGEAIQESPVFIPLLVCILLGAFTKSAQFPFHFWLPAAMAAPTPVSAFLHSATMVKAGIYLLARLTPAFAGSPEWSLSLILAGSLTMLTGSILAVAQVDLKKLLAYSTVSALGSLVMLLGVGTDLAIKTSMLFLLVHSLYKGGLFMVAGTIDHETGTRDTSQLGGLFRAMPLTGTAAALSALSMAGLPPLFGFLKKELLYETVLTSATAVPWLVTAAFITNALTLAVAGFVAFLPFFGKNRMRETPHEGPWQLWLGPLLLATLGLIGGVLPRFVEDLLAAASAPALLHFPDIKLALWHGLTPMLVLSIFTVAAGLIVYSLRKQILSIAGDFSFLAALGPTRAYFSSLSGLLTAAKVQTKALQSGRLRTYVAFAFITLVFSAGWAFLKSGATAGWTSWSSFPVSVWILGSVLAILAIAGAIGTVVFDSRLVAVTSLGVTGYAVALIFLIFGAPDLAVTQFAIETMSVILFVLVLRRLPKFLSSSRTRVRIRDATIAVLSGGLLTALLLATTAEPAQSRLAAFFSRSSLALANGRNVVNVILVDFRGFDTLGEITVLAAAALGIYALMYKGREAR